MKSLRPGTESIKRLNKTMPDADSDQIFAQWVRHQALSCRLLVPHQIYVTIHSKQLVCVKKKCSWLVCGQQRWMRTQRSWGVSKDAETSSPAGGHGITVRLEGWWTQGKNSYWALLLWDIWTLFANQAQGLQKLQKTCCSLCNIVAQGSWWMFEYPDRGSAKTWPAKKNIY